MSWITSTSRRASSPLGGPRLAQHRADRPETVRHQRQLGRRAGDRAGHHVDLVSAGQQPLGVLEGPLLGAAAARIEVIDDQGDSHGDAFRAVHRQTRAFPIPVAPAGCSQAAWQRLQRASVRTACAQVQAGGCARRPPATRAAKIA